MIVALMGYRGSGKTTVGQLLAKRLGYGFIDTDAEIVRAAGETITQIFRRYGEAHFRDLEAGVVARVLGGVGLVVALGGGAVLREVTRELLRERAAGRVYLECDVAELARRISADPASVASRPSLTGAASAGDVDEIARVLREREPVYRELATVVMDVTGRGPAEVAAELAERLR